VNFEEGLKIADAAVFAKTNRHLKDLEIMVLRGAWEGKKYHEIAEASKYTPEYLMQDVGSKLWKLLSVALGEEVSKTDFKVALERRSHLQSQTAAQPIPPTISSEVTAHPALLDWGEVPDVSIFFGRDAELNKLSQ
jgi:hypothetical protein